MFKPTVPNLFYIHYVFPQIKREEKHRDLLLMRQFYATLTTATTTKKQTYLYNKSLSIGAGNRVTEVANDLQCQTFHVIYQTVKQRLQISLIQKCFAFFHLITKAI